MEISSNQSGQNSLSGVDGTGRNKSSERLRNDSSYDLDTQEYLDLMMEQMKNQNPEDPMKTEQMMDQTSSIVQLQNNEKMSSKIDKMSDAADGLTSSINEMFSSSQRDQYISKIGDDVSVETTDGERVSGTLEKVRMQDTGTSLVIGGDSVATESIQTIGQANQS